MTREEIFKIPTFVERKGFYFSHLYSVNCVCGRHWDTVDKRRLLNLEGDLPKIYMCSYNPDKPNLKYCGRSFSIAMTVEQKDKEIFAWKLIMEGIKIRKESEELFEKAIKILGGRNK